MSKIISFLEAVGAILIVAALALWSGEYWKTSNILWWAGLACVTPAIAWKAWQQKGSERIVRVFLYVALVTIGIWWFGKKDLKVKIPYLPNITIQRGS